MLVSVETEVAEGVMERELRDDGEREVVEDVVRHQQLEPSGPN